MSETKFQAFLDRISDYWTDRNFETWADHVSLPFSTITLTGHLNNKGLVSLREDWDLYCQTPDVLKIAQIIRKGSKKARHKAARSLENRFGAGFCSVALRLRGEGEGGVRRSAVRRFREPDFFSAIYLFDFALCGAR